MSILKQLLHYFIWILVSFLFAVGYTRIILGPKPSTDFIKPFDWLYILVLQHLGLVIGSMIAVIFILIDVFYLKEKLKNNSNAIPNRFLVILIITFILGITHYVCEKIIDII